tara:strand:- start:297 stop:935 length:639 start_codon:yes stop_codon:yes gene_type:complete
MQTTIKNLNTACLSEVKRYYDNGTGLKSVKLKNYTSGDGNNEGMESMVERLIWLTIDSLGIDRDRVEVDQEYFKGKDPLDDPQRMDFHIWIDGKVPVVIESRAWIDKPFYLLKRAVVRNFMTLPYVRQHLVEKPKFIFVGLCIDIKDRLRLTSDKTMGFGEYVHDVKFSPFRRNHKKGNYFDHGFSTQGVSNFVDLLVDSFAPYAQITGEKA